MNEVYFIIFIHLPKPEVFCKVFKDNQGFIAVAESNKLSPRKHIAIKYHTFCGFIPNKIIWIWYIDTREQTSDVFTKPLGEALFMYIWRKLSGFWFKNVRPLLQNEGVLKLKNNSNSQLIRLKCLFSFQNASEKVLVSLKPIIHIITVFITRAYGFWTVRSDLS